MTGAELLKLTQQQEKVILKLHEEFHYYINSIFCTIILLKSYGHIFLISLPQASLYLHLPDCIFFEERTVLKEEVSGLRYPV